MMSKVAEKATQAKSAGLAEGLLEQAIQATKQTKRSEAEELIRALTDSALDGTVSWNKSLVASVNAAIKAIDETLSKQLREIMHHEEFSQLEGSWRGLHHLVDNTETSTGLKIRVLNAGKREVSKDLDKAIEFDQSDLFKKVYESEFGIAGGTPYGLLVGDFEFTNHPEDIEMLRNISSVAAAGFCPFISAAGSPLLGFDDWTELSNPRDLAKIFDTQAYAKWQSFRETEDSRFVALTMPRALARLPYGSETKPVDAFNYEEADFDEKGNPQRLDHEHYCWMNSAYAMGTRITNAFAKYGWSTAIRGNENGGKVENLPLHTFIGDDGDLDATCPTEIGISDRREAELSRIGLLPLCHYKGTDHAVFFGAQTVQKPKKYDNPNATANAAISSRLPYMMATSRIAHFLKVMARDKIGSFMEASDCEDWLNRWILSYVNANPQSDASLKARYPLAEAKITVEEIPGQPGSYNAVAYLRPWLQMEELTASLRMVAQIPKLDDK
jgi:type VI secretion system protein ImpC